MQRTQSYMTDYPRASLATISSIVEVGAGGASDGFSWISLALLDLGKLGTRNKYILAHESSITNA